MKKTKYVFLIFSVVYILIIVLQFTNVIIISDMILLGLSLSALFMSLADLFENINTLLVVENELNFVCLFASNFLNEHIPTQMGVSSSMINIRNLKKNVELLAPNYKKGVHPSEFMKRKINKVLSVMYVICFVISIASFILVPFFKNVQNIQFLSRIFTLLAFSVMCFNLFISECIVEVTEKRNGFFNDKQLLIEMIHQGFMNYLNSILYQHEDWVANEILIGKCDK